VSGYTVRVRGAIGQAKAREYVCFQCGRFDAVVTDPPPDFMTCPTCEWPADRLVSAPPVHTQFVVSAVQGKREAKPHRMSMDTRSMGEGQTYGEWKAGRRKMWREHDEKKRRDA
jgi:hypothetical protein